MTCELYRIIIALFLLVPNSIIAQKSAKLYRAGALIGSYSTIDSALKKATVIGDSILLSPHIFYENALAVPGGIIIQGLITVSDSSIIDAEYKGPIAGIGIPARSRGVIFRDVICQNGIQGVSGGGLDSLLLKGRTIVRNCYSTKSGGALSYAFLYDHVKITNNKADSFGGAGCFIWAYDSAEICYNTAAYGGGVGYPGAGGTLTSNSPGVRIHHNTATIGGGGVFGTTNMTAGQIINNQAPIGAAIYTSSCGSIKTQNCYIYNPDASGKRQNEVYVRSGAFNMEGSWFGKGDTVGLIRLGPDYLFCSGIYGKYATTSWSVNRGAALSAKDTLFPIGAAFVYNDGTPMPPNACPWLVGKFSASTGTMLTPNPVVNAKDTMSSLFRTYAYPVGGSGSKPIDFLCIVDEDTFRVTKAVWGRTPLGIKENIEEQNVLVYPNPAKDFININGASIGSNIPLYDLLGHLIKNEKSTINNVVMDVKGLPAGTYILKITTKEGREGSASVILNGE